MTIHVKSLGEGPSLVFIHGWGFDHTIWLELARILAKTYTLHLVDLPGFGKSTLMNWVQFKSGLLEQLPANFAIIGWSLGGLYATRLACEEPGRVSHLLNIATSPRFSADENWPGIEHGVLNSFFANLAEDPQKTINQFITLQLRTSDPRVLQPFSITPEGLKEGLTMLATWDLRTLLESINLPTCYVFGKLDAIVPRRVIKLMQMQYGNFHYELFDKAAHMPFLTDRQRFIDTLQNFIQQ